MQSWFPFIPESASTLSGDVDAVYFYVSGVTVFFCTLIWLVIFFFIVRYRRRNAFEIPRPIEGSHKLETLWSVIPLMIAMSIFVWGAKVYFAQYRPPQNALEVYVVGKQWMWKFQHPTGQREINELHVPVGRKVKLIMKTGMIKPASRSGMPKMRPILVPLLKVRLITRPAMNRIRPTAMLNEKPYALSKVLPVLTC